MTSAIGNRPPLVERFRALAPDAVPPAASDPAPEVRDWGIIVMKAAGHGLSGDIQHGLAELNQAGTSKSAYITVRAEQEGHYTDFSFTDSSAKGAHLVPVPRGAVNVASDKNPVLSRAAMQSFILDAMKQYPARHYMISYESHGRLLRAAMTDMHAALAAAAQQSGHKIDVLVLDACFLAQVESASQFQDVASTLVASQEAMDGWRKTDESSRAVDRKPMDAKEVANHLVALQQDFTLSAYDLSKVPQVNAGMKKLGDAILAINENRGLSEIRRAIKQSQHFYTQGVTVPHPFHNTVDIYDFAAHLIGNKYLAGKFPALISSANEIQSELALGSGQFVFAENHVETVSRTKELDYYDVRKAHGVSMYLPSTPSGLRDVYTHFPNSQFSRETGWDKVIDHLTSSRSPAYLAESAEEDINGAALAAMNLAISDVGDWRKDQKASHSSQHGMFPSANKLASHVGTHRVPG